MRPSLATDRLEGRQCADVVAFNKHNPEERLHNARAVRLNCTYKPTTGHMLYSDDCTPMFKIIADTLNENFLGDSMCSEEMNFVRYEYMVLEIAATI